MCMFSLFVYDGYAAKIQNQEAKYNLATVQKQICLSSLSIQHTEA